MESNYRRTKTTVSLLNYHFVFCPRYRVYGHEVILFLLREMQVVKLSKNMLKNKKQEHRGDTMQLTVKIKLISTKEQKNIFKILL